jgi:hypothetical protein
MILRLSDELARKIRALPVTQQPLNANPFADWSCHAFPSGRGQFILAANTASLYVVLFPGRRVTRPANLESALFAHLQERLLNDGFEFLYKRLIDTQGGDVLYARPLNLTAIGTLRDLAEIAAHYIEAERLTPDEAANRINTVSLAAANHHTPRDAFRSLSFSR